MDYGVLAMESILKITKAITQWIRNQDMEFINGKMVGYIKGIFRMTIETDLGSFTMDKNVCIGGFGQMENRFNLSKLDQENHQGLLPVYK